MLAAGQKNIGVHVAAVVGPEEASGHPFTSRLDTLGVPNTQVVVAARSYASEYRLLRALITAVQPEVVHTHGYRPDVLAGHIARSRGIANVSTAHGFTGGGLRNRINERIQRFVTRRADAIIAVSHPLAAHLSSAGIARDKIHVVPNAFDASRAILSRSAARQRLRIAPDARAVGWVGRLSFEKGGDVMLDALARSDGNWRLSMIGDGPERDALLRRAANLDVAERVTWHGLVENAGSMLSAFDAFVLSSRTEGTPITLFEAMHASVPIVATRVGGVPDVVDETQAILVPNQAPTAIALAVADIMNDQPAAARRSALARARLHASFGMSGWLEKIDAVYGVAIRNASQSAKR